MELTLARHSRTAPETDRGDAPIGGQALAAAVFAGAALAASVLGSLATRGAVDSAWFQDLDKPAFYPPGAAFGIVWTVLYVMIAAAGFLAWRAGVGREGLVAWGVQMALNLVWSVLFFGLRSPGWALAEIVLLLAAIVWTIVRFAPVSRLAAGLMVPYALWVAFASVLTAAIVVLN